MKRRPKSIGDRMGALVEGVASTVRRRQARMRPRIKVGTDGGDAWTVPWNTSSGEEILTVAEDLIRAVCGDELGDEGESTGPD